MSDDPELLEEGELVEEFPFLADEAAFEAAEDDALEMDRFAGGGDFEKVSAVGAFEGDLSADAVGFGDLLVDGYAQIGKGGAEG